VALRAFSVVAVSVLTLLGCREKASSRAPTPPAPRAPVPRADAGAPASGERPEPVAGSMRPGPENDWLLRGHRDSIYSVALSPDGKHAATGAGDRTVRIWDLVQHSEAALITGGDETITALAFSPDGSLLAAGDRAFQVRLIRVADGTMLRRQAHPDTVSTVDFSPDGKWLVVSGFGGNTGIYPVDAPGPSKCDQRGRSAQFTDDGKHIVLATQAGKLSVIDFGTCKVLKETSTQPQAPFSSASGKATLVATHNGRDRDVLLWDALNGKALGKLEGHTAGVTTAQLSADGARALTASEDGTVRLWDVAKRTELKRIDAPGVPFATMSTDGTLVLIASGIDARVVPISP
jgi:WD40 repeat protein